MAIHRNKKISKKNKDSSQPKTTEPSVWQKEQEERLRKHKETEARNRKQFRLAFQKHAGELIKGKGPASLLYNLAMIYEGNFPDISAREPHARLLEMLENKKTVKTALTAIKQSIHHEKLPAIAEVLSLAVEHQQSFLSAPSLIAMKWLSPEEAKTLGEEKTKLMLAFYFTRGILENPAWYVHVLEAHPAWVAEVAGSYIASEIRAKQPSTPNLLSSLSEDSHKIVAQLCVPALLKSFPLQERRGLIRSLQALFKIGFCHLSEKELVSIITKRLSAQSLKGNQRVCWLAAALALKKNKYTRKAFGHIEKSEARAILFAECLSEFGKNISLTEKEQELFIQLVAPHIPVEYSENGRWNIWHFLQATLQDLSASTSPQAKEIFENLVHDHKLFLWKKTLQHFQKLYRS